MGLHNPRGTAPRGPVRAADARRRPSAPVWAVLGSVVMVLASAADDIRLTDEELRRIDEVLPIGTAAGDRYGDMTPVHR